MTNGISIRGRSALARYRPWLVAAMAVLVMAACAACASGSRVQRLEPSRCDRKRESMSEPAVRGHDGQTVDDRDLGAGADEEPFGRATRPQDETEDETAAPPADNDQE